METDSGSSENSEDLSTSFKSATRRLVVVGKEESRGLAVAELDDGPTPNDDDMSVFFFFFKIETNEMNIYYVY